MTSIRGSEIMKDKGIWWYVPIFFVCMILGFISTVGVMLLGSHLLDFFVAYSVAFAFVWFFLVVQFVKWRARGRQPE